MYIHKSADLSYYLIFIAVMSGTDVTVSVPMPMTPIASMVSVVLWMMCMSESLDYSIETTVWSSFILDYSNGAISLFKGVWSLNVMSISMFTLFFYITSVRIMYFIFKIVFYWSLKILNRICFFFQYFLYSFIYTYMFFFTTVTVMSVSDYSCRNNNDQSKNLKKDYNKRIL